MIPGQVRRKFENVEHVVEEVGRRVKETLLAFCDSNPGFAFVGRVKSVQSIAEKIESCRYSNWSELDDLYACSIVIPSLADEEKTIDFLKVAFEEKKTVRRGQSRKQPDVFRFDATRFRGCVRPASTNDEHASTLFEVQVRTAFEHAWTLATHDIAYKGGEASWKVLRLSAQIKATVEQLDGAIQHFENFAAPFVEHDWPEITAKRDLIKRLRSLVAAGTISDVFEPEDWNRFADNVFNLCRASAKQNRGWPVDKLVEVIPVLECKLAEQALPLSLSLWQVCLGILAKEGIVKPPLKKLPLLITDELLQFFPEVGKFQTRFTF